MEVYIYVYLCIIYMAKEVIYFQLMRISREQSIRESILITKDNCSDTCDNICRKEVLLRCINVPLKKLGY